MEFLEIAAYAEQMKRQRTRHLYHSNRAHYFSNLIVCMLRCQQMLDCCVDAMAALPFEKYSLKQAFHRLQWTFQEEWEYCQHQTTRLQHRWHSHNGVKAQLISQLQALQTYWSQLSTQKIQYAYLIHIRNNLQRLQDQHVFTKKSFFNSMDQLRDHYYLIPSFKESFVSYLTTSRSLHNNMTENIAAGVLENEHILAEIFSTGRRIQSALIATLQQFCHLTTKEKLIDALRLKQLEKVQQHLSGCFPYHNRVVSHQHNHTNFN